MTGQQAGPGSTEAVKDEIPFVERRSADRNEFSSRLNWWVSNNAPLVLVMVLVLTLLALWQLVDFRSGELRLQVDPSLEAVSTQSDEERAFSDTVRRRFGDSEGVLVVLTFDDGVYSAPSLRLIDKLSRELEKLDDVSDVSSITATSIPLIEGDQLNYTRVNERSLADAAFPDRLRISSASNPMIEGQLVSADGRSAAILVKPDAISERELLDSDLAGRIQQLADAEKADGVSVYITGTPVIRSAISDTVSRQLRRVVPAIALVVTLLLAAAFPSRHGVLVPLATITIALIWTLGSLVAAGLSLNLISALVPPFLITMGLAYCAHILSEFESLVRHADCTRPVPRSAQLYKAITSPVLITGFTTIAGLLALLLNAQRSMIEFALLSALGTAYLVVITLTFVPAALRYVAPRPKSVQTIVDRGFDAVADLLVNNNQKRRRFMMQAAAVVAVVALLLATKIQVGDAFVGIFPEQSRVRADYNAVNAAMGGVNSLDIVIDGGGADLFTDPNVLTGLNDLQLWLRQQPEVGAVTGLTDHVRLLNKYIAGEGYTLPESRDAIRQMLFVGEGEMLRTVVNSDRSSTLLRTRLTVDDTGPISDLVSRLESQFAALPPGLEAHVIGSAAVMADSVKDATSGQLQSVLLSLTLIYLCLSAQFMSLSIGLKAAVPTILQTALYFGALGLLAVPLNPTTILVECLVLGLAVDDTIHYLARFNIAAKRTGSEALAATTALRAVLRPVTLTKAILAIGFLTLVTGELRNQALFGWLAALTLTLAWLVDVLVTPSFMSGLHIVTLWDTLRLNLGTNVQRTIPLFAGLTDRQARIFALMANLQSIAAGTQLFAEGDASGDIYVVIEGEISVLKNIDGKQVEIKRMGRGGIVGERGYFGQTRNASVVAVSGVRLLRFDDADQERICRSYPVIAARIFLTLNRLQAQRQADRLPSTTP